MPHLGEEAEKPLPIKPPTSASMNHSVVGEYIGRDALDGAHSFEEVEGVPVVAIATIGVDEGGEGEDRARDAMLGHIVEHLLALVEEALAAEDADDDGVDVVVGFAPELALHVLEEAEGALPVAAVGELLEDEGEVVEGELVLEDVEATGDAAARGEAAELVD